MTSIDAEDPVNLIVLAADIRKSTFVMKEAVDFNVFASILNEYINGTKSWINLHEGWWDKFVGDGFLAYWMYEDADDDAPVELIRNVLHVAQRIVMQFNDIVIPAFRANSRNFPAGVGLSVGLDAGPAYLVQVAGDLGVVGLPVVGAVRMVSVSRPSEIVANVYLGEHLEEHADCCYKQQLAHVAMEYRATKEYDAQEVYPISSRNIG